MNVWVDPKTGERDRSFRPYIEKEELGNELTPYDPNNRYNYGLYQTAQPSCGYWVDALGQFNERSRGPYEVVDRTGRLHMIVPNWYSQGLKYQDFKNTWR